MNNTNLGGIIVFSLLFLGFLNLIRDIIRAKKYENATVCQGILVEHIRNTNVGFYGRRSHQYAEYWVKFTTPQCIDTQKLLLRIDNENPLEPNKTIDVRYIQAQHGNELINDISYTRLREYPIIPVYIILVIITTYIWFALRYNLPIPFLK